jgi:hypothetical protein
MAAFGNGFNERRLSAGYARSLVWLLQGMRYVHHYRHAESFA